ncbi:hypothetical protein CYMTET_43201 [Cymbomonas tetramitiformis]|uniref:Integrase zinc-binding domain-containing protein n=1 Tax=Cymbomonas tetramitiformis TaxID=36881 RepID=A0AAE0C498_9CHLO|nr:hypothetical protein CYMTET_43201 [Cymbomonas tetramitiformis]
MRIEEVIPTRDYQGNPTQLFTGADGTLNTAGPFLAGSGGVCASFEIAAPEDPTPACVPGSGGYMYKGRKSTRFTWHAFWRKVPRGPQRRVHPGRPPSSTAWAGAGGTPPSLEALPPHCGRGAMAGVRRSLSAGAGGDSPLGEIVFREAHDSPAAGHTGRDKTLERVLRRFWWKNASDDVGAWVASCPTCQAAKPRSSYLDGLLNPHSIPSRDWQDVGVDFVTGLPLTEQSNGAFVAFTCKLSKMVHVVPVNFGE